MNTNSIEQQLRDVDILALSAATQSSTIREYHPPKLAKYIILEISGSEFPFTFPMDIQHSHALPAIPGSRPVSAGMFMQFYDRTVQVGGESASLHLRSRPQDAALIKSLLTH